MITCQVCREQLGTCPQCGGPTVEVFSAARSEMYGNGWLTIHHTTHRVGDLAPLGAEECEPGRMGWGR